MRKVLYYEKDTIINWFKLIDYWYIQTKDNVKVICPICWKDFIWNLNHIKRNNIKSCWCKKWRKISGFLHKKRLTSIFYSMKKRCNNPNNNWYKNYWWRWIKCEWNKFEDFKNDMYESYILQLNKFWEKDTTLDRIDVNWNYCKSNCRWNTILEQNNNKTNSVYATYNWETHTKAEWLRILWFNLP